jgi:uncharacterized Rossmann fold enzyme
MRKIVFFGCLLLSIGLSSQVFSHTSLCSCSDQGNGTIVCEGGFSDGDSAAGMRIHVIDADGKIILAGYMNENSEFSFKKPEVEYAVIFDAGPGHTAKVPGSEITE